MEDSFTRFVKAIPVRNITANVAHVFLKHWVSNFYLPVQIHSDNGTQFVSSVMEQMCVML